MARNAHYPTCSRCRSAFCRLQCRRDHRCRAMAVTAGAIFKDDLRANGSPTTKAPNDFYKLVRHMVKTEDFWVVDALIE